MFVLNVFFSFEVGLGGVHVMVGDLFDDMLLLLCL